MRLLATVIGAFLTLFGFWLGGFDFDSRGGLAVLTYFVTLVAAGLVYAYPGWRE